MKKLLSVVLSLVLILGTVFAVPAVSASAATPGFDLNGWYVAPGTSGVATPNEAAQTVSFTGMNYRAAYTKVSNLEVGKIYDLSFDVSPTANFQLWIVPGNETISWDQGLPTNSSRQHVKTCNGTNFAAQFTATGESFWFVFRNQTGTAATNEFTFSNFSFAEPSAEVLAGIAIANGDWQITNGAGGTVTKSNNTVKFTGAQSQAMYTKLTGLELNTVYKLTFDVSPTINAQVRLLDGDKEIVFPSGVTLPNNTVGLATVNGTKVTAEFTAEKDSYYIFFRNALSTQSTTEFTFSNFAFETVRTLSDAEIAGKTVANGDWKITNGAGGTVTKSNNTVKFTGAQSQAMYTKLTGLELNTVYKLTFDVSPTINAQVRLLDGDKEIVFPSGVTLPNDTVGLETVNGTKVIAEFTAEKDSYYIFFRNALSTQSTTEFTFSNFAFETVRTLSEAEIAGNDIANNGAWDVTKNASGTVTKSKGTVKFTGAQYQDVSLPLTDLEANTTYTLSFINSSSGIELFANTVYVIPGETAYAESLKSKEGTVVYSCEASNKVNDEGAIVTTVRFTTDDTNTNYLIVFHNDNVSEVTLSNFEFSSETAYEFEGTAIRSASEDATQGMRFKNVISKDLIANGYNGKEVVEYGTLAAFEVNLKTDFTYENVDDRRIKKGVAFDKANGVNITFAEDDANVTYTAALININSKFYGLDMKVCSYMLLSDGSVVYGELQTTSVYGIMKAILDGDNDDDKAVVNAMLEDESVLNGYNAWLAK